MRHLKLCAATLALVALPATALAAPTQPQRLFRQKLVEDRKTAKSIRALLADGGGGFVDRSIAFRDLTGDRKSDAIVRVNSGGATGAVAVYVFSTDGAPAGTSELRVVYRRQALRRAATRVADGRLILTSARYAPGNDLCCPAKQTEITLRWSKQRKRFLAETREIPGPAAPAAPPPGA